MIALPFNGLIRGGRSYPDPLVFTLASSGSVDGDMLVRTDHGTSGTNSLGEWNNIDKGPPTGWTAIDAASDRKRVQQGEDDDHAGVYGSISAAVSTSARRADGYMAFLRHPDGHPLRFTSVAKGASVDISGFERLVGVLNGYVDASSGSSSSTVNGDSGNLFYNDLQEYQNGVASNVLRRAARVWIGNYLDGNDTPSLAGDGNFFIIDEEP